MVIHPVLAVLLGCILCSVIGTVAQLCPERSRSNCLTIASLVNIGILIVVIYMIVTSSSLNLGGSRGGYSRYRY